MKKTTKKPETAKRVRVPDLREDHEPSAETAAAIREKFSPETRNHVMQLAAFGIPADDIARVVTDPETGQPISRRTLSRYFEEELSTGATRANAQIAQRLFTEALGSGPGATASRMFWLKTRAGWRETDRLELVGKDGSAIEINHNKLDLSVLTDEELETFDRILTKLGAAADRKRRQANTDA